MHWVNLVDIFRGDELPDEYKGFVRLQASLEGREVTPEERVAIMVVEQTSCYIPYFLEGEETLEELEERLKRQEARMTPGTRQTISRALG